MPRTKPNPEPVLKNWNAVDDALREIAEINRATARAESTMNKRIDDIKAKFDDAMADGLARKARLEKDIEEFADANRADFGAAKTKRFTFGEVSYRIVHEIKPAARMTWIKVKDRLLMMGCIGQMYLKQKLTVDKEGLRERALSSDPMDDFPFVRLRTTDQFGYKVYAEEIQADAAD